MAVTKHVKDINLKNFRLKYLQLQQNIECKISENGTSRLEFFTLITFLSSERKLQEYFLRIAEVLVKTLSEKATQQQVIESLNKFVEIFRALSDAPKNTVQGLWSELFLIDTSKKPETLLNYWHNIPEEKFDFNAGREKIEVKSNSNYERIHYFTSEQLNPPKDNQVIVASLFTKPNSSGLSIQQLMNSILQKIPNDFDLANKLSVLVCQTLGSSLEQSIGIKYDHHVASDSLRFYFHHDISKIEQVNIPNAVSAVKYKSDLTELTPINPSDLNGILFKAIK